MTSTVRPSYVCCAVAESVISCQRNVGESNLLACQRMGGLTYTASWWICDSDRSKFKFGSKCKLVATERNSVHCQRHDQPPSFVIQTVKQLVNNNICGSPGLHRHNMRPQMLQERKRTLSFEDGQAIHELCSGYV